LAVVVSKLYLMGGLLHGTFKDRSEYSSVASF